MAKNEQEDLKLRNIIIYFFRLRWIPYLIVFLISLIFDISLFHFDQFIEVGKTLSFFGNLSERLIDFVIFLPSMAFVCLSLLPSVSNSVKIILTRKSSDGRVYGESLLKNFVYIMYISVFTLGFSVMVSILASLDYSKIEYVNYCLSCFQISVFLIALCIFFLPLVLIYELFLTVYLLHSILMKEFQDFGEDYAQFFKRAADKKISSENFQSAIDAKIQETLSASKLDLLEKLKNLSDKSDI